MFVPMSMTATRTRAGSYRRRPDHQARPPGAEADGDGARPGPIHPASGATVGGSAGTGRRGDGLRADARAAPRAVPAAPLPAAVQATAAALPAQPSSVHELKTLVLSRHPLVVIETAEEERLDTVLAAVARDLHLAVFDWTVTHGLRRLPEGSPVYGTEDPARLFAQIAEFEVKGLFVLKDAAAHVAAPAVARSFRELLARFAGPGRLSTVDLRGRAVDLPAELDALAVRYDLALPIGGRVPRGDRRGRRVAGRQRTGHRRAGAATTPTRWPARSAGLTLNQARQVVAHVAIEDGRLQPPTRPARRAQGRGAARRRPARVLPERRQHRTSSAASPASSAGWTARASASRRRPRR